MESSGKKYPRSGSLEVEPETGILRQEIFKEERDLPGGWGEGRKERVWVSCSLIQGSRGSGL